jgi:REP element-mobilizing transposase RayT
MLDPIDNRLTFAEFMTNKYIHRMSTGYQISDQEGVYFLTLQIINWVDVFTRQSFRDIIIENLKYCQQNKGLQIFAYVIMSNHVHILVQSQNGKLSDTIRDFKGYTSKVILDQIEKSNDSRKDWMLNIFSKAALKHKRNKKYQLWTHENHAEQIYSDTFVSQKIDYIHMNPVRSGIVANPEDYLYSSARNYAGLEFVMDVSILPLQWKTLS